MFFHVDAFFGCGFICHELNLVLFGSDLQSDVNVYFMTQ